MEPAEIVRVECDSYNKKEVTDHRSDDKLIFWRGSDVAFQLGLTQNGEHILAANMGKVIVELKDRYACPDDPSLWREEISSGDAAHTADTWAGGTTALVTAYLPRDISERLVQGYYWLIVRHEGGLFATHLSHKIEVKEDHSRTANTYNFAAGGTTTTSTGTPTTTSVTVDIPSGATELTVTVPSGFTPSHYSNHYVTGTAGEVDLSSTVQLGSGDITFFLNNSPASSSSHDLTVDFLKLS